MKGSNISKPINTPIKFRIISIQNERKKNPKTNLREPVVMSELRGVGVVLRPDEERGRPESSRRRVPLARHQPLVQQLSSLHSLWGFAEECLLILKYCYLIMFLYSKVIFAIGMDGSPHYLVVVIGVSAVAQAGAAVGD